MKTPNRFVFFIALFALLLLLSTHGVIYVPFWNYRGLDLQNLHAFHHQCPEWPIPYLKTGAQCGDPLGRPMLYPPLIYWIMAWTRPFPFYTAEILWSVAIPLLTLLGICIVERADRTPAKGMLWGLIALAFLQMPMLYAIERGNNDAAVIPIYAAAIFLFARMRFFWSGLLLATACWMKVYPVIPSFVLLVALGFDREKRRKEFLPLFEGFALGGFLLGFLLLPDSYVYLSKVLPEVASDPGGFGLSSHTLYRGATSWFLKVPVLMLWIYFTAKTVRRDPVLVLSAGFAISTFFPNLSNDYNLITAFPFLFVFLKRTIRPRMDWTDFGMLCLSFAAFVGDRTPLEHLLPNRSALFLQIFWIILFPNYVLIRLEHPREVSA